MCERGAFTGHVFPQSMMLLCDPEASWFQPTPYSTVSIAQRISPTQALSHQNELRPAWLPLPGLCGLCQDSPMLAPTSNNNKKNGTPTKKKGPKKKTPGAPQLTLHGGKG